MGLDPSLRLVGVSPLLFNGLLYGGDMAPDVKQGAADGLYRVNAKVTHEVINGVPTCGCRPGQPNWQTPEALSILLDAGETVAKLSHRLLDEKEKTRFWRIAYLTVCAQFVVVTVAAVWGWTR